MHAKHCLAENEPEVGCDAKRRFARPWSRDKSACGRG